jgi:hypothetical protein
VRRREDLRKAARRRPIELFRDRHEDALVDSRQLCLPAPADDAHDAIAWLEARGAGPALEDLSGELEPGNVRWRAGRSGIEAATLHHVGAVETGGVDADEDFA